MIEHASLQAVSSREPASPEAVDLAMTILAGEISVDDAIARAADHLLTIDRVEAVVIALTTFLPTDQTGWTVLGGRAWLREWVRDGAPGKIVPPPGAGPEQALSMPWLSQVGRRGVAVLPDRELLPPEAAQDRTELAAVGVAALGMTAFLADGRMFGSVAITSSVAGAWQQATVQDFRLLASAIKVRLTLEQSRRSLAEAIEAGAEAQLATQQLFGAVGHELRTPLSAILGYTEVLLDDAEHGSADDVSSGMKRDGPVIVRSCERLLTIVDSLLGAGRALSTDDQRQEISLADAVADVIHWHRTPARTAGVDMQAVVDPSLAAWGHPSAVRQVLANLLGNAIAHHRPTGGSVHLTAEALVGESAKPMVRIVVRDDGPGLTPEQLQHAFEPFVRFAAPTTQGSGLGLSLSRTIAEREGGAVRGESTLGTGSSFWLELPAYVPRSD
ncbi:HAMP domain-containing histidine kinase [Nocardioides cavernae]|uniref:histidine kinase n=1 Tax=Nocardioides cavernae TaxID=1921566 RepID=A0ABR8N8H2_9ACTN|nr:HAMP domain-containing sensor histidine kinase [Nocardioides cavernae]MBD3923505.1 HAMP domain-containing histidine kinase [Nocardioides cavernae]MBM7511566.1 signal transduction histidine kinase [Nocardioides cavernae]